MKVNVITQEQFEDVQFNPELVVVQKEKTFGKELHTTWLYVFETETSKEPIATYERSITAEGTTYTEMK